MFISKYMLGRQVKALKECIVDVGETNEGSIDLISIWVVDLWYTQWKFILCVMIFVFNGILGAVISFKQVSEEGGWAYEDSDAPYGEVNYQASIT
eukprot:UN20135